MASRAHPQQGFRSCLGVMGLKSYGQDRLEAACQRALRLGACSFKSLQSILKNGLDYQPLPETEEPDNEPIAHPNIRGGEYYH